MDVEPNKWNSEQQLVYSFGSGDCGQLGVDIEYEGLKKSLPTHIALDGKSVSQIATSCGSKHNLLLVGTEVWSFGHNDYTQLGRSRKIGIPQCIEALESHNISQIAVGQSHSLVLTHDHNVYCFGRNNFGQCAVDPQEADASPKPRLAKALMTQGIVQISCGNNHNVALSDHCVLWSWGLGTNGQTGREPSDRANPWSPLPVAGLDSIPICAVYAGGDFTIALTISGNLYSFGQGHSYQLGHGDRKDLFAPRLVEKCFGKRIVKVACGREHCLALTESGVLYGWGSSEQGQLATTDSHIILPQPLEAARGLKVVDIACGAYHSLIVMQQHEPENGIMEYVLSFGQNKFGQLGIGSYTAHTHKLNTIYSSPQSVSVFAAESHSVIKSDGKSVRESAIHSYVNSVTFKSIESLCKSYKLGQTGLSNIKAYLEKNFAWPATLNGSFLLDEGTRAPIALSVSQRSREAYFDLHHSGKANSKSNNSNSLDEARLGFQNRFSFVDMISVRSAFDMLLRLQEPIVLEIITKALMRSLTKHRSQTTSNPETLRMYLIIMEHPVFTASISKFNLPLFERLINSILVLPENAKQTLYSWWSRFESEYFSRIVSIFISFLTYLITNQVDDRLAFQTVKLISVLYKINVGKSIIPYEKFYLNPSFSKSLNLENEYQIWSSQNASFTYLNYPFFLPLETKMDFIHIDTSSSQFFNFMLSPLDPYMVISVRRDHLVEDSLRELAKANPGSFHKKLKVKFIGEDAIDQGGVSKEFFQLIVHQLMDPVHGMFIVEEDTNCTWFNPNSLDTEEFYLIGLICGLAIYNNVLLDIRFPDVVYKKILESCPGESLDARYQYNLTIKDYIETFPTVGKNLLYMLNYEGNIEETFGEYFQVSYKNFDQTLAVDLIEDGGNVPVTNANIAQYVQAYVNYELNLKIGKQFDAFKAGFLHVFRSRIIKIFRAEELARCIVGDLDFIETNALRSVCQYDGDFMNEKYIDEFWNIFDSYSQEERRSFLTFVTGTDRLPVGLKFNLTIQKNGGDTDLLPTASTCFNVFLLPEYATIDKLRQKLAIVIQNKEGFGLR